MYLTTRAAWLDQASVFACSVIDSIDLKKLTTGSSKVAEAWVAEMRFNTTKDGHDQMPLRKVLWRYRDVLYDLPATTQCRRCTRRTGRDPCAYLLWHNHRKKREEHKSPRTTACGYHAPPHELVLRHQHHGHASSPSPAG